MKHKTRENQCSVDIEFLVDPSKSYWRPRSKAILEPSMRLRKANKSLAVSMPVPYVNPHQHFFRRPKTCKSAFTLLLN